MRCECALTVLFVCSFVHQLECTFRGSLWKTIQNAADIDVEDYQIPQRNDEKLMLYFQCALACDNTPGCIDFKFEKKGKFKTDSPSHATEIFTFQILLFESSFEETETLRGTCGLIMTDKIVLCFQHDLQYLLFYCLYASSRFGVVMKKQK